MKEIDRQRIVGYVEEYIPVFHQNRLNKIQQLKLDRLLKRKNPYLFRVKNIITAADFVKVIVDAYLSSQEETLFGNFLEGLAIYICNMVYGGQKSSAEGIDLEFEKEGTRYLVSIKSGPNWGNSSQINKMRENFKKAKQILKTSTITRQNIVAVNGCCYGRDNKPNKGDYLKLCGQKFWEFISGDEDLYIDIIEPLGHRAKEKNEQFQKEYVKVLNKFTREFIRKFCNESGEVLWDEVVKYNSGKKR